jgi:glycosyltransferase involved in cell wall biosynthesis
MDAQKVHILGMVYAFRELGHHVEIVSLVRTERETRDPTSEWVPAPWIQFARRIPYVYELIQLGYNVIGLPMLLWKVLRINPDFIYERYSLLNFTGVMVARFSRKPIILEVNSPFAIEQGRDRHIRAVRLARWVEKHICNAADWVVVVTEVLRTIMVGNGVRPERLLVMHNGVNLNHFSRRNPPSLRARLGLDGKLVLGYAGCFRNWQGLQLLIEAFHSSGLGQRGAVLLLVGDGVETASLRKQIAKLKCTDSIILAGPVPHSAVPDYVAVFDIAVQPAATEYCCPLKLVEYMALAKAITAPRQANVLEVLGDGNAVFFTPGDPIAFGRALKELAADPQRAANLGVRARAELDQKGLLWAKNAQKIIQVVSGMLSGACSASGPELVEVRDEPGWD